MKLAFVGLPQCGKTTIFHAVAHTSEGKGSLGGHGPQMHLAAVKVPDARLKWLAQLYQTKRVIFETIEFLDIPNEFKASGSGVESGTGRLADLREADGLVKVLRAFHDDAVPHPHARIDPVADLEEVDTELLVADLDIVDKRIEKLRQPSRPVAGRTRDEKELSVLDRCKDSLAAGNNIGEISFSGEESKLIGSFSFLTQKPFTVVLNIGEESLNNPEVPPGLSSHADHLLTMCGKVEMELAQLDESDRAVFMEEMGIKEAACEKLIRASFDAISLCVFLTASEKECRAWALHRGDSAVIAAGKIHTDLAKSFIRAETISFEELKQAGTMKDAKAHGKVRLEGKDYSVQDGDVILFRSSLGK